MRPTADPGTPRAYGYWELVWLRLRRDRMAVASAIVLLIVFLICFAGEPVAEHFLGHGPNDIFSAQCCNTTTGAPVGLSVVKVLSPP